MTTMAAKAIESILKEWAENTRLGNLSKILAHHDSKAMIYDVLAPMSYAGTDAYRKSWDEWQPDTQGEAIFQLEDLEIIADDTVGFAYAFLRCGGQLQNGKTFEDLVRATFCLEKGASGWKIRHQHISKPVALS